MSYLLDTHVLSEIRKPQGDAKVRQWFGDVRSDELFLSVLVLGEVRQGVERLKRRDPAQAASCRSTSPWPTGGVASTPPTRSR